MPLIAGVVGIKIYEDVIVFHHFPLVTSFHMRMKWEFAQAIKDKLSHCGLVILPFELPNGIYYLPINTHL